MNRAAFLTALLFATPGMSGLLPSTLGYDDPMKDEDLQTRARKHGTVCLALNFGFRVQWRDRQPAEELAPEGNQHRLGDGPETARRISIPKQMPRTTDMIRSGQWRDILQAYLACVSFVDCQIGRVLEALGQSPYRDNTIIP